MSRQKRNSYLFDQFFFQFFFIPNSITELRYNARVLKISISILKREFENYKMYLTRKSKSRNSHFVNQMFRKISCFARDVQKYRCSYTDDYTFRSDAKTYRLFVFVQDVYEHLVDFPPFTRFNTIFYYFIFSVSVNVCRIFIVDNLYTTYVVKFEVVYSW